MTHLTFLLPGVLVRDFCPVILVLAGSMDDGREDLSVRSGVASKLVGHELPRWPSLVFQNLAKEAFGGSPVAVACDQDIEDVAILVDRSPKVMTLAADRDDQLVHMPDVTEPALSPPQSAGIRWSKLPAPGSNGFVGYADAAIREKILAKLKVRSITPFDEGPRGHCYGSSASGSKNTIIQLDSETNWRGACTTEDCRPRSTAANVERVIGTIPRECVPTPLIVDGGALLSASSAGLRFF